MKDKVSPVHKEQLLSQNDERRSEIDASVACYDDNLLDRIRGQWQFGDWESLCSLSFEIVQHHPDRAKISIMVAAGHLQLGNKAEGEKFIRFAQDCGLSNSSISRVLIAGVHNSIGRACAIGNQQVRAAQHFKNAIKTGAPNSDVSLFSQARTSLQLSQLGLPPEQFLLSCPAVPPTPVSQNAGGAFIRIKEEIKTEILSDIRASTPNPYVHNRILTPTQNKLLRDFAGQKLKREGLKSTYIDYLAAKSIHIERNCVGRLATTVQDVIARQLVCESIERDDICILEIGALYGVSLSILYNHAVTRFSSVKVVCLDPFDGYYGKALDAVLNQPVRDFTFVRNMQLSSVPIDDYKMIKHYSTDSEALLAASELSLDLLIIDDDHSYEGVKYDFDTYFSLVKPGGYVILDDYDAPEWPGVQKFVDDDLKSVPQFDYIGAISRTAVGRKQK